MTLYIKTSDVISCLYASAKFITHSLSLSLSHTHTHTHLHPPCTASVCFLPVGEFTCFIITFPTNYYFYNEKNQACESKVSFCPVDRPGIFKSLQECLNTCELPLAPTPPPPTTTEPETTRPHPPTIVPSSPATTDYTTVWIGSSGTPEELSTRESVSGISEDLSTSESVTGTSEFSTSKSVSGTSEEVVSSTHPVTEHRATTTVQSPRTTQRQTPLTTNNHPHSTTTDKTILTTNDKPSVTSGGIGTSIFQLNKFDLASLALGVLAFLLIFVLVGVVMLSLYKRHVRLRRKKQEVM